MRFSLALLQVKKIFHYHILIDIEMKTKKHFFVERETNFYRLRELVSQAEIESSLSKFFTSRLKEKSFSQKARWVGRF